MHCGEPSYNLSSDRLKILHVIPTLSPSSGGPAEALRQLVRAYAEIGVEPEIVCQDEPDSSWIANFAAHVHALGGRRGTYGRSPLLRDWLQRNVARFDGVVIHSVWTYPSVAAAGAARGRVPYAVFPHGMLDPWFKRRYPLKHLKKYLYWPVQYPVLRDAKSVLFTSSLESELAPQSFWPHKWTSLVVPYGTNEPPLNMEAQREAFQALLPQLTGRRLLLFLSRIHEKKGCDLLVEAFASVAAQHRDVDLVIAGPDKDGLQAKLAALAQRLGIAERIYWPGMLTGDAKWGAFRACEAMILPSHQENFGVVVAEALACGRPALISNQVNLWPQVEEDHVGLVEPDTLDGTRSLLTRWFDLSDAGKAEMSARAILSFKKRYSMQNCALAIRNLFSR
jgi:glycosyltransferase involved in cell wall biosynthesis